MDEKPVDFVAGALADLRAFPQDVRRRAGFELHQVQRGLSPSDWKPMATVGPGVVEIRISTGVEHRILYIAKFEEAVYVLHAFEKKSRKTTKRDVELARARLAQVIVNRPGALSSREDGL